MSRARGVWWLLGAVLAVLLAATVPGASAGPEGSPASAGPGPGPRLAVPAARTASGASVARTPSALAEAAAVAYEGQGQGPACAPGAGDHGRAPAVPPRDGRDHACAPAVRLPAGPDTGGRALPAGVRVRGPDRPAPGPVELSVMRV
ncbi:hypothetical protein GCM10010347_38470 [Streptomyces cirratus]|uniref:Uncharacterized protein n=1 Tax=Streptomyces cirratus TaxID=68187 RepID=A0ABQ3EZA7_9ACTN|nr:hypothetical protein [Streptomyces cirratus]GHB64879.1 hypothetical protein GCM10010347_38470 [Streptomyces cirratus]